MFSFKNPVISALFFIVVALLIVSCTPSPVNDRWNETVKRVSSGVVSIQVDVPVGFDGDSNGGSQATGFIVDAKQGIILTNRHVVTPGPVTAKAVLLNNEEVDLVPLYIDPIHDFGFYRYDPSQIKFLKPHQFSFSEQGPSIGQEIRIIGNDAGQKISILDGTIARVDRRAPYYGRGTYNDFNTFYIQAATASVGGSSGSPVINVNGEVVALNAGSQSESANAFYLPTNSIRNALSHLQKGEQVKRGSILTTFENKPYAELKRLGLSEQLEAKYRKSFPQLSGLLVIESMLPESSAANNLALGDILLSINGQPIGEFTKLETLLNNNIKSEIDVSVFRAGQEVSASILVDDLDESMPSEYLKLDNAIFHNLSYQQARHFNKPIGGVYIASSGGHFEKAGVSSAGVITELDGQPIDSLASFIKQLSNVADGTRVKLRYFNIKKPTISNFSVVEINRQWQENLHCKKAVKLDYWPCTTLSQPIVSNDELVSNAKALLQSNDPKDALVQVMFSSPFPILGRGSLDSLQGTGIIVDRDKGLVVIPRSVVPSSLGHVKFVFDNRIEVKGNVEYVHPLHNIALVSYVPAQVADFPIAQMKLSTAKPKLGDEITQIGLNSNGLVEYRESSIENIEELYLGDFSVPRYSEKNLDTIHIVNANLAIDGALLNGDDEMVAMWTMFQGSRRNKVNTTVTGIAAEYIRELIDLNENKSALYTLDLDLTKISVLDAFQMGLPKEWLTQVQANDPSFSKILGVYNAVGDAKVQAFQRGDLLLEVDGTPVANFRQVELLTQKPQVEVTLLRGGKIMNQTVNTVQLPGQELTQVFNWAGLSLHAPHRAARQQGNFGGEGIYVAYRMFGSPAERYGLDPMRRIVGIDDKEINTNQDFIDAVVNLKHRATIVVKTLDFRGKPDVITLRLDNNYWPFSELKYVDGDWVRIESTR